MNFPLTPGPPPPREEGDGSLRAAFDRASAALRRASITTTLCAAGSSLIGLSRDGGVTAEGKGGESSVSFRPLGGGSEVFLNFIH